MKDNRIRISHLEKFNVNGTFKKEEEVIINSYLNQKP